MAACYLSQDLTEARTLDAVLDVVYDGIRDGLGYDRVGIKLFDREAAAFEDVIGTDAQGRKIWPLDRHLSLAPDSPIWRIPSIAALLAGAPVYYTSQAMSECPPELHYLYDGAPTHNVVVQRIVWSAGRQMRLVQDLLLVSKLDLGQVSVDCSPLHLPAHVHLAITELQGSYPGQQVVTDGPPEVHVLADAGRVTQIMLNLLDNAAKYSPEGSPILASWEVTTAEARVRVRDQGPGIPIELRDRLFTRFGRLSGSPIRAGRVGTGLGLFLGRQLARARGGDIELEATGPEGSTFCLRLQLASDQSPGVGVSGGREEGQAA